MTVSGFSAGCNDRANKNGQFQCYMYRLHQVTDAMSLGRVLGWFAVLPATFWLLISATHILALIQWKRISSRKPRKYNASRLQGIEGVSIIKPISAMHPDLEQNITSYLRLQTDVPFEILFCIEVDDQTRGVDEVERLVRSLQRLYKEVNTRIFVTDISEHRDGNPKVLNMTRAYNSAKYPIIWINDAQTECQSPLLLELVPNSLAHRLASLLTLLLTELLSHSLTR
eukprot:m.53095 g.53095  ORF g.53095 m.53095 type:complete len:227 (-) comp11353_c0_seq4:1126-1806(-)